MCAFKSKDGSLHTNRDTMKQADAKHMAHEPAKQPVVEGEPDGDEPQIGDQPMMTEHHGDGSHTTTHASGKQKHHGSSEELMQHLQSHEGHAELDGDEGY
jgi:hypothetical protein